jgi:molybdopterin-guanine dinucleotide biosynthesis protein A
MGQAGKPAAKCGIARCRLPFGNNFLVAGTMTPPVLGLVLAGGQSRRFGSDKAFALLDGQAILSRVCDRATLQVDKLFVNRNDCTGLEETYPRLRDGFPGEGPLAGVLAGLEYAAVNEFSRIATFPCDSPFFPLDTVKRLALSLEAAGADYSVARHDKRFQYAFSLWDVTSLTSLRCAFAQGLRSLRDCAEILRETQTDFPSTNETPNGDPFFNINTREDFEQAANWVSPPAARRFIA